MQTENIYIRQIIENLKEINPYMILLFGSYAYGTPHQDSDIDLLVVTNDNYVPKSFTEKNILYIATIEHILDIAQEIPVDLIVHTLPMYKKFIETGSSFSKEILNKGIILYESNNKGMA
jgi:predicted nucleotidyltransferase